MFAAQVARPTAVRSTPAADKQPLANEVRLQAYVFNRESDENEAQGKGLMLPP